jgi:hypothetical protein
VQILNQQRTTIVIVVHVLIIAVMLVVAFFPHVFVEAKTAPYSGVYIPFSANISDWGSQVCEVMTVGGCDYFASNELAAAWGYLASVEATGVEMELVDLVMDLGNGQDLWKVEFTIIGEQGDSETHLIYAVMSDELLDRIVSLDGVLIVGGLPWN